MTKTHWRLMALFAFVALLGVLAIPLLGSPDTLLSAAPKPISNRYFGMHIHEAANAGLWPAMPFGAWRLSDTGVAWADMEVKKNDWRFDRLDRAIEMAIAHDVEVLLPLALTPTWASARPTEPSAYGLGWAAEPRDLNDWRAYVRTMANRYKGKVRYYEIWNEPNTDTLYSGSVETLVQLARVTREELNAVDPGAKLVSPSFVFDDGVKKLDRFLELGGGRYVDIIGFHFYMIDLKPEAMLPLIKKVQQVMARHGAVGKPLWNTESGWLIANRDSGVNAVGVGFPKETPVLSIPHSGAYVARSLALGWAAGLERFYWYAWDNGAMGFAERQGAQIKPVAQVYARVYEWLRGSVLQSCVRQSATVWVCTLSRGKRRPAWLVWDSDDESRWTLPPGWQVAQLQTLDGRQFTIDRIGQPIYIGPSPILLVSDGWRQASAGLGNNFIPTVYRLPTSDVPRHAHFVRP